MITKTLWKLSVCTTPEAEEAVMELLPRLFSYPASSYTDVETGRVLVSAYLPQRPAHYQTALREGLARARKCGLNIGSGKISLQKLSRQDWAESWKRHFKPIEVGPDLLIRPGWSKRRARKGQAQVVLDPGLSFGTGQHPTTAFCLRQVVACRKSSPRQAFLDIGTGSGILAIAAAKLGYAPVEAFDVDPESVRITSANARRNRVHNKVRVHQVDVTKLPVRSRRRHDLVCANLISTLLITERDRIVARVKPGGKLVLAGILKTEFSQVARAYRSAGLRLFASRTVREWRSGAFMFG
jgi:ribosomal protein L11 methyltransferase